MAKVSNFGEWFNEAVNSQNTKVSSNEPLSSEELAAMFNVPVGTDIKLPDDKQEKRKIIIQAVIRAAKSGLSQNQIIGALKAVSYKFNDKNTKTALSLAKNYVFNEKAGAYLRPIVRKVDELEKALSAFRTGKVSVKLDGIDLPLVAVLDIDGSAAKYNELITLMKKAGKAGVIEDADLARRKELKIALEEADRKRESLRTEFMAAVGEVFPAKRGRGFDAFADIDSLDLGIGEDI